MQKLVKNAAVVDDQWQLLDKEAELPASGQNIVNVSAWEENAETLLAQGAGLWLDSDQAPSLISLEDINSLPVIAINFPAFADGRGYSYAYILRKELGYTGELRAVGDVLRDQMFYMKRVGFDSFVVRNDRDAEDAIASLTDFENTYQASADKTSPLMVDRWS